MAHLLNPQLLFCEFLLYFFFPQGIGELQERLIRSALAQKYMGEKVPEAWLSLEKHLDKYAVLAESPFLSEKYFVVLWSSDRHLTSG